jgi:hypothetical protein
VLKQLPRQRFAMPLAFDCPVARNRPRRERHDVSRGLTAAARLDSEGRNKPEQVLNFTTSETLVAARKNDT